MTNQEETTVNKLDWSFSILWRLKVTEVRLQSLI